MVRYIENQMTWGPFEISESNGKCIVGAASNLCQFLPQKQ